MEQAIEDRPGTGPVGMLAAGVPAVLTQGQKAAVIVRLLLAGGALPELSHLSEEDQAELVLQIGRMNPVDRATVEAVADEFEEAIRNIGVSFPNDPQTTP